MKELTLVIMAAGMGSRYGGLKQIDPVDEYGNKIIDFSIFDAVRAGFKRVVFIIKKENEADFRSCIGDTLPKDIKVEYAFQELTDLPEGYSVPEGRVKPWGTVQAILSCRHIVDGPFAVINADDFYGKEAFSVMAEYLKNNCMDDTAAAAGDGKYSFSMVGYELGNTLTDNGYVSRGVCEVDADGYLVTITERTHIEKRDNGAAFTEDGENYTAMTGKEPVSMNLWGFSAGIMKELEVYFEEFLKTGAKENPLKGECFLPFAVDTLLKADRATVKVLHSSDRWFGVTYKEDKPFVMDSIKKLKAEGIYPEKLWE